jgi:hypothetical protein
MKILLYTLTMFFVLTLGVTYAAELSVTDFSGRNYDIGINPAEVPVASMEGISAGGMRDEGPGLLLDNGVTDFSGKTYEDSNLTIKPAIIEAAHAGGMRDEGPAKEFFNVVTDFSGRTYD